MYDHLKQAIEDLESSSFMRAPVRQAKDEAREALAAFQRESLSPALREASIALGDRLEFVDPHQAALSREALRHAWKAVEREALGAGVEWRGAPAGSGRIMTRGRPVTGTSYCPTCGTSRVGAFRWCRSCQFDFDAIASRPSGPSPASAPSPAATLPSGTPSSTQSSTLSSTPAAVLAAVPTAVPAGVPAAPVQYLGMLPSTRSGILAVWLGLIVVGCAWILASNDFTAAYVLAFGWFCVVSVPIGLISLAWWAVRHAQVNRELERRLAGRK